MKTFGTGWRRGVQLGFAALALILVTTGGALVVRQPAEASVIVSSHRVSASSCGQDVFGGQEAIGTVSSAGPGPCGAVPSGVPTSAIFSWDETYSGTELTAVSGSGSTSRCCSAEYNLFFTVATNPVAYSISGSLSGDGVVVLGGTSLLFAIVTGSPPAAQSGILAPGNYRLEANTNFQIGGSGQVAFTFTLGAAVTPTPTNTPLPPTSTATPANTATPTATETFVAVPILTNTPVPPTDTPTPADTATSTPVPPTNTSTATATSTSVPATPTATAVPAVRCFDVTGDGGVDFHDVRRMLTAIRQHDRRYDLNGDGRTTGRDLVLVIQHLGQSC